MLRGRMKQKPFAAVISAWRNKLKLSRPKAAELLGMSPRTLQEWEQGRSEPRGFAKIAILEKLGHRA